MVATSSARLSEVSLKDGWLTWLEGRPSEDGRNTISGVPLGSGWAKRVPIDLIGKSENARNAVHEYGGGSYDIVGNQLAYVNFADSRIYLRDLSDPLAPAEPLTPEPERPQGLRYADLHFDPSGDRIWCIREIHGNGGSVRNEIATVNLAPGGTTNTAVSGADFYAYPLPSPDGKLLAWISWNQPNMPWDGTELWVAQIDKSGHLFQPIRIAGGKTESILQPAWSPAGDLVFVSDATGWWNLYRTPSSDFGTIEALYEAEAEFGEPFWQFGMSTYAFAGPDQIVAACRDSGTQKLIRLNLSSGKASEIDTRYKSFSSIVSDGNFLVAFVGGRPDFHAEIAVLEGDEQVCSFGVGNLKLSKDAISRPVQVKFPTTDGARAFGWYYSPQNPDFEGLENELPPLITMSHGGPTSATSIDLRLDIQFWTSRGFAVIDVDYRGSTGYGRFYRDSLKGKWGIYDVDDCVAAAQHLASENLVDAKRMAIRGRSAGGFTTLCALTFRNVFAAGASYYGIADAETLAKETHKFEARYLDGLIGPYPEAVETYRKRSPIHSVASLLCPVIFFQGLEDRVVPPEQAEMMIETMKSRGIRYAYVAFAGEQHGFRRASTIEMALQAELNFYSEVLGL